MSLSLLKGPRRRLKKERGKKRTKYPRKSSLRVRGTVGTCEGSSKPPKQEPAANQANPPEEECKTCSKI